MVHSGNDNMKIQEFEQDMAMLLEKEIKELGVGGKEFLERHKEILELIENSKKGKGNDFKSNVTNGGVKMKLEVPVWKKSTLTLEEAAAYTGIGMQKLRDLSADERCEFVLWNGTKRMFKRRKLEEYLESAYSI